MGYAKILCVFIEYQSHRGGFGLKLISNMDIIHGVGEKSFRLLYLYQIHPFTKLNVCSMVVAIREATNGPFALQTRLQTPFAGSED